MQMLSSVRLLVILVPSYSSLLSHTHIHAHTHTVCHSAKVGAAVKEDCDFNKDKGFFKAVRVAFALEVGHML